MLMVYKFIMIYLYNLIYKIICRYVICINSKGTIIIMYNKIYEDDIFFMTVPPLHTTVYNNYCIIHTDRYNEIALVIINILFRRIQNTVL